ncbi:MAG: glycosyltransferase family 9 protein, partial [Isosphaeraceae bacterium]|nr:glycosyltransferase family 9 protein [Isosphaeraceae bacterium]
MPPEPWRGVGRLLAVRLDNIGDIVMVGPALRALRRALPGAKITLWASPTGSLVAPMLPWIDDVIVHRVVWQDASGALPLDPDRERALIAALRARRFDAAVIFTSFSQSPYPPAYACYLAGIPIRLGQSKEFGGSLLTQWVRPKSDGLHQVDRNLHLLEAAGFSLAGRQLELHVSPEVQEAADRQVRALGINPARPFLVLAPGASCPARRYDLARFLEVARRLEAESGLPMVVIGSAREADLLAPIVEEAPVASLVGRISVPEMAAVLRRARLVIANDSGPMHVADAFGRPMVILYSGTELEEQWRPRGSPARL